MKTHWIFFLLLNFALAPSVSAQTGFKCPKGRWSLYDTKCFYLSSDQATQAKARVACQRRHADLASIASEDEDNWIKDRFRFSDKRGYWIGLYKLTPTGQTIWFDGSTSTYRNWADVVGEPNEAVTGVEFRDDGWYGSAAASERRYICSREAVHRNRCRKWKFRYKLRNRQVCQWVRPKKTTKRFVRLRSWTKLRRQKVNIQRRVRAKHVAVRQRTHVVLKEKRARHRRAKISAGIGIA